MDQQLKQEQQVNEQSEQDKEFNRQLDQLLKKFQQE